ncbi:MAG: amidohydrolase family protein, partial [Oscillospiraceae bacterium]|nr:amidohydrolase family protein [Oscillospiraceae bacterium]
MIKIINAQVFNEGGFAPGSVEICGSLFGRVAYDGGADGGKGGGAVSGQEGGGKSGDTDRVIVVDAGGRYAVHGFIDIHLHGCVGYNFYDAAPDGMVKMLQYLASRGVTAVCPTTLTLPEDVLTCACASAASIAERVNGGAAGGAVGSAADGAGQAGGMGQAGSAAGGDGQEATCAAPVGVYLEGPFFTPSRAGAQNPAYVIPPDVGMFRRLVEASKGLVKVIAMSPEVDGASEFISTVAGEVVVSLAHTNASYEDCVAAFELGASHATHLYNAMKPQTHRTPNAVGAVLDLPNITAELICDGLHLHPAIVRTAMRLLGPDRPVFISDSMMAAGLNDGVY